jgi:hypothetical protein
MEVASAAEIEKNCVVVSSNTKITVKRGGIGITGASKAAMSLVKKCAPLT